MIVVSDTSPLTSLAAIGRLELFHDLYGQILIPPAVAQELRTGEQQGDHAPFLDSTQWLVVCPVSSDRLIRELLEEINLGEAEAIALALERRAELLLIDEAVGRRLAEFHGLDIVGLLGTLLTAKHQGLLLAVKPLMDDLISRAGFWISPALYDEIVAQAQE